MGTVGPKDGQFLQTHGITIDSQYNVYVSDAEKCNIQKFMLLMEDKILKYQYLIVMDNLSDIGEVKTKMKVSLFRIMVLS